MGLTPDQKSKIEAKQILNDYNKPSENIDIGNVYFAATQFEAAYASALDDIRLLVAALERAKDAMITCLMGAKPRVEIDIIVAEITEKHPELKERK